MISEGEELTLEELISAIEENVIAETNITAYYQYVPPPTSSPTDELVLPAFEMTSTSFPKDGIIPNEYSCDAEDFSGGISPQLSWTGAPNNTVSFAIVLVDPHPIPSVEVPRPWTHWIIYNIDPNTTQLNEGIPNVATLDYALQGQNSWGVFGLSHPSNGIGYSGPCPNQGDDTTHTYPFTLYALSTMIQGGGLSLNALMSTIEENTISETTLTGYYQANEMITANEMVPTAPPTAFVPVTEITTSTNGGDRVIVPEHSMISLPGMFVGPATINCTSGDCEIIGGSICDPLRIPGEISIRDFNKLSFSSIDGQFELSPNTCFVNCTSCYEVLNTVEEDRPGSGSQNDDGGDGNDDGDGGRHGSANNNSNENINITNSNNNSNNNNSSYTYSSNNGTNNSYNGNPNTVGDRDSNEKFEITSTSFPADGVIAEEYSCHAEDGGGVSPELSWSGAPNGTESYAILLIDSDAVPGEQPAIIWTHWLIYNIPADATGLSENVPNDAIVAYDVLKGENIRATNGSMGVMQGQNSWGVFGYSHSSNGTGYGGPCPKPGDYTTHTYPFRLFALNKMVNDEGLTLEELIEHMQGSSLGVATITGYYQYSETFRLTSSSFSADGLIADEYSCHAEDGGGISPELTWSGAPSGTVSFALVLIDPDAVPGEVPSITWTHWLLYNIPVDVKRFSEGVPNVHILDTRGLQGQNSWGVFNYSHLSNGIGYGGPCPNPGDNTTHTYSFTLYALDTMISGEELTVVELMSAMEGHIIAETTLTGYYQYLEQPAPFEMTSTSFPAGGVISDDNSCHAEDGGGISPDISWSGAPIDTLSFAVVLIDPDAIPGEMPPTTWTHWLVYNIPADVTELPGGVPNEFVFDILGRSISQGQNSWGVFNYSHPSYGIGYGGPCPLPGDFTTHTYSFTIYALNTMITIEVRTLEDLMSAMKGNILAETTLTGYYQYDGAVKTSSFEMTSTSFPADGMIPDEYSCNTEDDSGERSPALSWSGAPSGTVSFAMVLVDPNAIPGQQTPMPWTHWLAYNIPADVSEIPAGLPTDIVDVYSDTGSRLFQQGRNSWGVSNFTHPSNGTGYGGPCPNPGDFSIHMYVFRLFALNSTVAENEEVLTYEELMSAIEGNIIAETILTGYYQYGSSDADVSMDRGVVGADKDSVETGGATISDAATSDDVSRPTQSISDNSRGSTRQGLVWCPLIVVFIFIM